jgi:hypothetical protein
LDFSFSGDQLAITDLSGKIIADYSSYERLQELGHSGDDRDASERRLAVRRREDVRANRP